MRSGMKMLMASNRGGGSGGRNEYGSGNSEMRQNYGGMEYGRSEMAYNRGGSGGRNEMGYGRYEGGSGGRNEMRGEMRRGGGRNEYEMENSYGEMRGMENRSRRSGRSEMRNGMDEEMEDMEPESRRRFPRRRDGTFAPRSEMREEQGGRMHYPMYPMPIYDEEEERGMKMHRIGFEAESEGQKYHGNIVPMRSGDKKLTREMAQEWMGGIENEDGSKGPKWGMDETKRIMKQKGIEVDPMTFWVVMNALYSDYCNVFKKHNVSTIDLYADLACAWIMDKDAVKDKAGAYYMDVVKH